VQTIKAVKVQVPAHQNGATKNHLPHAQAVHLPVDVVLDGLRDLGIAV
jgi:hypothetical protein